MPRILLARPENDKTALTSAELENVRPNTGGDDLLRSFVMVYDRCPPKMATPRKFIALVRSYIDVYSRKKAKVVARHRRLEVWLSIS